LDRVFGRGWRERPIETLMESSIERWIGTSKGQLDRSWIRSLDSELDREMEKKLYSEFN